MPVPLTALFGKVEAASVKVSPRGNWLGWLARGDSGVLDLYIAPLPLQQAGDGAAINAIPGARQLTAAADRDICFSFHFTKDDSRIVYLRETEHGSELYHLYALDLSPGGSTVAPPVAAGRDLLAAHPKLTTAVGFVGGLQLWLPTSRPNIALLATGRGSLLWDLSQLDLETGDLLTLQRNPCATYIGIAKLAVALCWHLAAMAVSWLVKLCTAGLVDIRAPLVDRFARAPASPLQYFVNGTGDLIGCAECCVSTAGIALRFSRWSGGAWRPVPECPAIPFGELNMQLVGSGAATGTLRFDVVEGEAGEGSVALHTCNTHDTTAYVQYPGGSTLAHDPRADIDGFVENPATGTIGLCRTKDRS
jgi:hypothetical protein